MIQLSFCSTRAHQSRRRQICRSRSSHWQACRRSSPDLQSKLPEISASSVARKPVGKFEYRRRQSVARDAKNPEARLNGAALGDYYRNRKRSRAQLHNDDAVWGIQDARYPALQSTGNDSQTQSALSGSRHEHVLTAQSPSMPQVITDPGSCRAPES